MGAETVYRTAIRRVELRGKGLKCQRIAFSCADGGIHTVCLCCGEVVLMKPSRQTYLILPHLCGMLYRKRLLFRQISRRTTPL